MQCPTKRHLEAANCVLKYLKGTLGKGIPIKKCRIRDIEGFANFNWARSTKVSKSTIGYGETLLHGEEKYNQLRQGGALKLTSWKS